MQLFVTLIPIRTTTTLILHPSPIWCFCVVQGIITTLLVTCNCKILKLYTRPRLHKSRKGNKYAELMEAGGGGAGASAGSGAVATAAVLGTDASRYAVLSVTNPNYMPMDGAGGEAAIGGVSDDNDNDVDDGDGDDEDNVFADHRPKQRQPMANGDAGRSESRASCLVNLSFNELDSTTVAAQQPPQSTLPSTSTATATTHQQQISRSAAAAAGRGAHHNGGGGGGVVVFDRLVVDALPVKDLMDGPVPQSV